MKNGARNVAKSSNGMTNKLTPREQKFVALYLADPQMNAMKAAREAGFKQPHVQGTQLMKKPKIKAALSKALNPMLRAQDLTAERVIVELMRIAFFNPKSLKGVRTIDDLTKLSDDASCAVASLDVETRIEGRGEDAETVLITKIRTHDKLKALELMAKRLGLLIEKHEHSVDVESLSRALEIIERERHQPAIVDAEFVEEEVKKLT